MTFGLSNHTFYKKNTGINIWLGKQANQKKKLTELTIEWDMVIKLLLNMNCLFNKLLKVPLSQLCGMRKGELITARKSSLSGRDVRTLPRFQKKMQMWSTNT